MSAHILSHWGSRHWLLAVGFVAFAAAVLPPVLHVVNEPTLVAGYPLLYVWAFLWGIIGIGLLYGITQGGYFGIDADEVPPELHDVDTSVATEGTNEPAGTPTSGED